MGQRALVFSRDHPEASAGYTALVERLERLVARADVLGQQQLTSMLELRAATAHRADLRRQIRRTHMSHIARVAGLASADEPGLEHKFDLVREDAPYMVFLSAAQLLASEAQQWRELLVRHGMSEPVLEALLHAVEEFEVVNARIRGAQTDQVTATAELKRVAREIVQVVRALDPLNRHRFVRKNDLLAAWLSASNIIHRSASAAEEPEAPPSDLSAA
jgi:hypothetical protein